MSVTGGSRQVAEARRLHELGVDHNNAGRPARALPLLRKANELITVPRDQAQDQDHGTARDAGLQARIWISIATSESELGGLARGMAALEVAQQYVAESQELELQARLDNQLGYMQVRGGRVEDGLGHLDAAVALIEHVDFDLRYSILLNRGTTHLFRGDLRAARDDLTGAVTVAQAEGRTNEAAKAQHNLGYLEFLAGNLALALQIMDGVLQQATDASTAVILLDRARVLIESGLHREADEALREAGELFRAERLFKDLGEVELARAECALLDGQISAARRLAGDARTRFRRRGNERWRRDAELLLLQSDLAAGRPGLRLAPVAVRLAKEYRDESLTTQARTAQLIAAEALLRAGRRDDAGMTARDAGPVRPGDPISARLQTRLVRGKLYAADGDLAAARREIRTGLDELARHQARFGSIDVQTAGAVHGRALGELHVSLALSDGRPARVLAAIEMSRATSSRIQPVTAPDDPVAADALAELRKVTEALRGVSSDPASAGAATGYRRRIAELEQLLRNQSWHRRGSGQAERAAGPDQIHGELVAAGLTGVSFFESGQVLHALIADAAGLRLVPLSAAADTFELVRRSRADLDMLARGGLPAAIVGAMRQSLSRTLDKLDARLIRPLGLSDRRLVLFPTGPLAVIAWNLLPSLVGCPVAVSPSGTAWLRAHQQRTDPLRSGVFSFAGPGLRHAEDEARAVAELWSGAVVRTGVAARRSAAVAALSAGRLVHLAAHGTHQAENPLFSSIRLSDGPIFAYELDDSATVAEHVVLSACELGQATVRPGDEALGLTNVLLRLGTRCVVSGVANMHDQVASEVMPRYHRALAAGRPSDIALAEATAVAAELPAPFVCFGAGRTA